MVRYTIDLLKEICIRDNFFVEIETFNNLNRESRISFSCFCGSIGDKTFRMIHRTGGYCNECTLKQRFKKTKEGYLNKYGVENPFNLEEIKQKRIYEYE